MDHESPPEFSQFSKFIAGRVRQELIATSIFSSPAIPSLNCREAEACVDVVSGHTRLKEGPIRPVSESVGHRSCRYRRPEAIAAMLDRGGDVEDSDGWTKCDPEAGSHRLPIEFTHIAAQPGRPNTDGVINWVKSASGASNRLQLLREAQPRRQTAALSLGRLPAGRPRVDSHLPGASAEIGPFDHSSVGSESRQLLRGPGAQLNAVRNTGASNPVQELRRKYSIGLDVLSPHSIESWDGNSSHTGHDATLAVGPPIRNCGDQVDHVRGES